MRRGITATRSSGSKGERGESRKWSKALEPCSFFFRAECLQARPCDVKSYLEALRPSFAPLPII
jgi:hypothetical protein